MDFSQRLKELRLEKKMTQRELAHDLCLSPNIICEWEKARCQPGIETLKNLSQIFECSIDYLIGNADDFGNITIKSEKSNEISPDGKELLNIFNALDPLHRVQVLEYARYFATRSGAKIPKKNA